MKSIDFSAKHDVLIRYPDGSLRPMDEPHYIPRQIAPNTWQILSSGDYHYLVAGDEEAISIDTGYGAGNLREYLESLCQKPVHRVINTHHHFDHTANNSYFNEAYMGAGSVDHVTLPFPSFAGIHFPRNYAIRTVTDGSVLPLKGRDLEVISIPDHAPGSIAILDRKERLLFSGDEFMDFGKRLNGSAAAWLESMEKVMAHRHEFDRLCGGPGIYDAKLVDVFYKAAKKMAAGEISEGVRIPPNTMTAPERIGGQIVYDCRQPHPEDRFGGRGKPPALQPDVLLYEGMTFLYDRNKR